MRFAYSALLALGIVVTAAMGSAFAQTSANGSVRGYVRDQQNSALPGATVTATSVSSPLPVTVATDAEGYYRLLELAPGEYSVTVELAGFARLVRTGIVVRSGLNLGVDIELALAGQTEAVTVHADAPMVESQTAVQAFNISGDMQRRLPLSYSNHWSNFLAITPGVTGNQLAGRTADSYTLRGSDFASHVIQIDGADMSSAQQNATTYMNLSSEAIADVQVKTGATDAASPLGVGAVMNIATKSGTNEIRGAGSISTQRKGWSGNNNPGGTVAAVDSVLPEAALGGPLLRDHAWLFGSYRYEKLETGVARSAAQLANIKALVPGFTPQDTTLGGHYLLVKGTARLSSRHNAEVMYSYDPQTSDSIGATDGGVFVSQKTGGKRNMSARLSSIWGSNVTTRIGVSYNNKALQILAGENLPSRPVASSVILSSGRLTSAGDIATLDNGNAGWSYNQPYYKSTISGDLTYFHSGWLGSHEFQTGIYYQPRNHQETVQHIANGGFGREGVVLRDATNPAAGFVPYWREIYDTADNITALTDTRDFAFYVQDAWHATDRLTVNAGLRVDAIKRVDKLFDVVVQDSPNVGPRFGVNYALTEDRMNVVRASWVRVHDVISINPATAGTNTPGRRDLYDLDLDGSFETVFVTPASSVLTSNRILDPDRTQPYINEWTAGYRRQLPGRLTVDASFVHRDYKNRTALIELNGIYQNGQFLGYQDERSNEIYKLTGNEYNWHVYEGLEFQVVKDSAKLRWIGSYTRAWRHMAGTWQPNDPASFIQPNAFDNNKSIGDVRSATSSATDANSLSGTNQTDGTLAWQDHVARGGVVYFAPWQFVIASNYTYQSGGYGGPVVTRLTAADPQFGTPTVTLSNGRIVSNPLATVIRFAYDDRGEGQLKLPALHIWNLRVGRDVALGQNRRVELAAEVFNLVNSDADQSFQSGGNQRYSANYGKTQLRQSPRSLRLSARFAF
jgi:hypothetical protein